MAKRFIFMGAILGLWMAGFVLSGSAQANTPIESFSAIPSTTQAGGHPDLEVQFSLANREVQGSHSPCNCEDARDITVHLPAGFIGNPHATPQCTLAEFSANECPIDSQVGVAKVVATNALPGNSGFDSIIYNLVPPPDQAGLLGFKLFFLNTPVYTGLSGRTGGDYGLDVTTKSAYHGETPLESLTEVLWGVPAAPSHDLLRFDPELNTNSPGATSYIGALCDANGALSTTDPNSVVQPCFYNYMILPPVGSNSPLNPFQDNPTTCGAHLTSTLEVLSYDGETTKKTYPWPEMTGCDQLSFNPSLYAQPTTASTDSASGIDVDLQVPQPQSASVPSPSELQSATVTLPVGFSINPSAADGKTVCADADGLIGPFATEAEAICPEFSKVGSLTIEDPALPGPLPGFVYLGEPLPGQRFRIFLIANGFATHVKLAGTVTPDPVTGQLTISFQDLPQNPLTAFNLHFFGSEAGLLATPTQCGSYPVTSVFTPWDSSLATQTSTQYFTLSSGPNGAPCPGPKRPFNPGFSAGVTNANAGAHSPFSLELTRRDGDQDLSGLTVATPPGILATLKGVSYCPESALASAGAPGSSGLAQQASPSCPAASQIGTSSAASGAGTHPVSLPGKVYLAGPYKGAPLSLAIVTPAVSGPYDLGSVVVRAALRVNHESAQITAVSDPLPQIFEGIPLRLRDIQVNLDRPGFMINPTNCDPLAVNAQIEGDQGAVATRATHFQVANCNTLPFGPKLALKLSGATKRTGSPALTATLTTRPGESGIASTTVALPPSEQIENAHIRNPCTKVQFAANSCPPGSILGFARAETPLLEKPLEGPVYFRSAPENKSGLPDLVAALRGQLDIDLDGKIETVHGRLRTSFKTIPDAPVSRFTLSLYGGKRGLLVNSQDLCAGSRRALIAMTGQNGAVVNVAKSVDVPCGKSRKPRHASSGRAKRTERGG